MQQTTTYLRYAYWLVLCISVLYGIYQAYRFGWRKQHGIAFYLIAVLCTEAITFTVGRILRQDASIIYNLALPVHVFLLGICFYLEWKNVFHQRLHLVGTLVFMLAILVNLGFNNLHHFVISNGVLLSIYFIFIAMHWFYFQISHTDEAPITQKMFFWICTGLLSWSVIFIFRLLLKDYLFSIDPGFLDFFQVLISSVNVLVYLFFIKSLQCLR